MTARRKLVHQVRANEPGRPRYETIHFAATLPGVWFQRILKPPLRMLRSGYSSPESTRPRGAPCRNDTRVASKEFTSAGCCLPIRSCCTPRTGALRRSNAMPEPPSETSQRVLIHRDTLVPNFVPYGPKFGTGVTRRLITTLRRT